ncbi:MAG: MFS transporter [Burkholderiaceae bacterium]|jgi:NNP family nitrate/nitrite transporter-like MFS transporter
MRHLIDSLRSGNWRSLIACFLYFDTGFTVWVMYGPLAPFIGKAVSMSPADQGFLVATPVLSAAILRVALGNLFQSMDGKKVALLGMTLSALPCVILPFLPQPGYDTLLILGVFLGVGGASFAVALPMAGSNYPPKVQGLVLGLAAAGNVGAVLDGFLFPRLADVFGWQAACAAALPLLAVAALTMWFWGCDRSLKSGAIKAPLACFAATALGLIVLVLAVRAGWLFGVKPGILLLPIAGALYAIALLPARYRSVFKERDTWVLMLVYSVTFGGFVGMSSYVSTLLTATYSMSKIEAGGFMSLLAFTGAMVRPVGGWVADRITGVKALLFILFGICLCDAAFSAFDLPRDGAVALFVVLYLGFGLGNGATFQLVPNRWRAKTGLMTGLIGAAGGIGGFYLPVIMGLAKEATGSFRGGFAVLGAIAATALVLVLYLRSNWSVWARPALPDQLEFSGGAIAEH